nr:NADH-ubiquinone oxidoreductase-F iron-sulfur binding region domain-containing protein [uncultured Holophaga sp.]
MPTAERLIVRALDPLPGTNLRAQLLELHLEALLAALEAEGGPAGTLITTAAPCPALSTRGYEVRVLSPVLMDSEDQALLEHLAGRTPMAGGPALPGTRVVDLEHLLSQGKGTRFVQVQGAVACEAVLEVPEGTTYRQVLERCGTTASKFVLAGGPTGALIPESGLDSPLAAATLVVGSESDCTVDLTRRCLAQTAAESCGRCLLCREGSYQLQEILTDMTTGKSRPDDEAQIRELAEAMAEGSRCELGRQAARPLLNGLLAFPEEFEAHQKRKRCPALVCRAYVTFHILGDTCSGCGKCLELCPEEAIEGEEDYIHVIDTKACTQCGLCFEVCPERAIVKAGPVKPRTPKEPVPVGSWKKR